jgi:hypothetical protein
MPVKLVEDSLTPHLGGNMRHGDFNTLDLELLRELVERFAIRSALDVGCGEGHVVWLLHRLHVISHGIDGLRRNVDRSVFPIACHDLAHGPYYMPVDMTLSLEVAEHIDEQYLDHYVATLCNGRVIVMTHAVPGEEDGFHHVNCRAPEYWIGHLSARGYRLDYYNDYFRKLAASRNPDSFFGKTGLVLVKDD